MTRNEKQSLDYIQYRDLMHDYRGHGILVKEDNQFFFVTNIIGALFVHSLPGRNIDELPNYPMIKADCEWFVIPKNPISFEDWIFTFPIEEYSVYEIHHIGLFFEWFFYHDLPLNERLEKSIHASVLDKKIIKTIVRFILDFQKADEGLLKTAISPTIQRILHQG